MAKPKRQRGHDIRDDGAAAFRAGVAINRNPYVDIRGRGKGNRWAQGWRRAQLESQQGKKP